ncbi:hypothetical protein [Chlorogloeopsis sp. ULAP02]
MERELLTTVRAGFVDNLAVQTDNLSSKPARQSLQPGEPRQRAASPTNK